MAQRSNQQTKSRNAGPADTIAESKLARIEHIANEALELLGEESPKCLRESHEKAVKEYEQQISNLEHRLKGAADQIKSVEGELRHATKLASERLEEAERVWDVASEQAADLKKKQAALEEQIARNETHTQAIAQLESDLAGANANISDLKTELDTRDADAKQLERTFEKKLNQAEAQASELEALTKDLQANIDALSAQLEKQQSEMSQIVSELASTAEERDAALSQAENAENELSIARDELAERATRLQESQSALTISREQIAELETSAAEMRTLQDDLRQATSEAKSEVVSVREEIAEMTSRLAERDRTISNLSREISSIEPGVIMVPPASEPHEPCEHAEEIERLQNELKDKDAAIDTLRQQMDRADARADSFKSRTIAAEESLEKANAIVMRARRRASVRTEQYSATIEAMSALHVRCDVLQGELDKAESLAARNMMISRLCGTAALLTTILAIISAF